MKLLKKPNKPVIRRIGPHTRKVLSEKRLKVRKKHQDPVARFTTEKKDCVLWLETNYDLLQYTMVVTPHVIKIHKLYSRDLLDALLYLFPIQFFTRRDFHSLPLQGYPKNFKRLIRDGYIELYVEGKVDAIFTTSTKTKEIVKDYYLYLSGRKKIKTNKTFKTDIERKQDDLLAQLKRSAKNNPERFKNYMIR